MPKSAGLLAAALAVAWRVAAADLADPTLPAVQQPAGTVAESQLPRVSAIIIHRRGRHALFDGHTMVRVGERWEDLEVVAIEPGSVQVRKGDKLIDLPLLSKVRKTHRKIH